MLTMSCEDKLSFSEVQRPGHALVVLKGLQAATRNLPPSCLES